MAGKGLVADLPPTDDDRVRLELHCQGWCPQAILPASNDPRTLGVQLQTVTVRAADAGDAIFNANTGQWLPTVQGAH